MNVIACVPGAVAANDGTDEVYSQCHRPAEEYIRSSLAIDPKALVLVCAPDPDAATLVTILRRDGFRASVAYLGAGPPALSASALGPIVIPASSDVDGLEPILKARAIARYAAKRINSRWHALGYGEDPLITASSSTMNDRDDHS